MLLGVSGVLLRVFVRLLVPGAMGPDTFAHLEVARQIRSNGHRLPDRLGRVTLAPEYNYPFLYHWILSCVPERHVRLAEVLTGPISDGLQTSSAALFAYVVFKSFGWAENELFWGPIAVGILVALSPALLNMSGGPRAYIGSPRPVGQLLFVMFVNAALVWGLTGNWLWLLLSVIAIALLAVASKFGNQATILVSIVATLFGIFEPLICCLLGYALAAIVWRKAFFRCIRGQIKHTIFYVRHLQEPYLDRIYKTMPGYSDRAVTAARYARQGHPFALDWMFADENPAHRLVIQFPAAFVGLALWAYQGMRGEELFFEYWPFAGIVIATMIVSVMTSTQRFRFLGEHYRYLEHTVTTQAILAVGIAISTNWTYAEMVLCTIVLLGPLALVSAGYRISSQYKPLDREWKSIADGGKLIDRSDTVVHAMGGLWWPIWSQSKKLAIAHWAINCDIDEVGVENFKNLYGNFPRPGVAYHELAANYGVTHALGRTRDFETYANETGDSSFCDGSRTPLHSGDGIKIFAIDSDISARLRKA